ncbi:MAG: winged helix-turn-helix transcriptional regulator [Candidatus Thermoplasmatota archaeon]|nr:winged helix-turn-helix transcriptional regulator [Candidatus Thermoplasmatota archaeon]
MKKVLWWLIAGTRGGKNRLRIIKTIGEEPMNANQLAKELDLDYKTIKHHLELLEDNGIVTTMGEGYGKTYFLTDQMEDSQDILEEIMKSTDIGD